MSPPTPAITRPNDCLPAEPPLAKKSCRSSSTESSVADEVAHALISTTTIDQAPVAEIRESTVESITTSLTPESTIADHPSTSSPLTSRNLRKLDVFTTPSDPSAGLKNGEADSSHSTVNSNDFEADSGEKAQEEPEQKHFLDGSDISHSSMTDPPTKMRAILEGNRMFIGHKGAGVLGAGLIQKAKDILDQRRVSDWTPQQAEEAQETLQLYAGENEAAFSLNFWNVMFKDNRKIPKGELTEDEKSDAANWMEQKFSKDHLRLKVQSLFAAGSIPAISMVGDSMVDKILADYPRVAKPKPDIAFSIYKTAFNEAELTVFEHLKCDLPGPHAYHTFCIIEYKSMDRPIFEAENQCIRGGAAMVLNRRKYNAAMAEPKKGPEHDQQSLSQSPSQPTATPSASSATMSATPATPDTKSFAFSIAIAPDQAKVFVNWALVQPENVLHWHMHLLRVYSFEEAMKLTQLHHDLNNILDWGLGKRKNKIVGQLQKLRRSGYTGPIGESTSPQKRKRDD